MKILHTADWHLGRSLYGRKRYEEFSAFLDWLSQTITEKKVEILLVAGDVFELLAFGRKRQLQLAAAAAAISLNSGGREP